LEKSDNLYADSLLKTLGAARFEMSGSYYIGIQAIREIMTEQGVDLERATLADGSGLSRYNRLSAANMADILAASWYLWKENAPWLAQRDRKERWLKTGYMRGVNNMAGYVFPGRGQEPLIFVVMLNGLQAPSSASAEEVRMFYEEIRLFHRKFLKLLYAHKN